VLRAKWTSITRTDKSARDNWSPYDAYLPQSGSYQTAAQKCRIRFLLRRCLVSEVKILLLLILHRIAAGISTKFKSKI
jgi:hypothetical protein